MIQEGVVVGREGDRARVLVRRGGSCRGCGSCGALGETTTIVTAVNKAGAREGARVAVRMSGYPPLRAAFIVYIVPLIAFVLGYSIGYSLAGSETFGILSGVLAISVVFLFARALDRALRNRGESSPEVVEILPRVPAGGDCNERNR